MNLIAPILAVYGLTRLLTQERGPFKLLEIFRAVFGSLGDEFKKWVNCPVCFSIAVTGLVVALNLFAPAAVDAVAVMGGALLLIDMNNNASAVVSRMKRFTDVFAVGFDVVEDETK